MKDRNMGQTGLFEKGDFQPDEISITELKSYLNCSLEYQYRFKPRDRNYDPGGAEVTLGRILHKVTEKYLSVPKHDRTRSTAEALITSIWDSYKAIFASEADYYRQIIVGYMDKFCDSQINAMHILYTEYPFNTTYENLLIKGRIDCIAEDQDGHILMDFKLQREFSSGSSTPYDEYMQVVFYYFGIRDKIFLHNPRVANYYYPTGEFIPIAATNELLESCWSRIKILHLELRAADRFKPTKNLFCSSCMVRKKGKCPLWRKE